MAAVLVGVPLLAGCAGSSCDDLPALRAERDAARQDYLELSSGGAGDKVTAAADEELHALDARVYDLERSCQGTPG